MNYNKTVLPINVMDFVYCGGNFSRHEDSTMSRLVHLTREFRSNDDLSQSALKDVTDSLEAATIELQVRIAGAKLVQATYYIRGGELDKATASFESAKQLLEEAHTKAQSSPRRVDADETSILQALAVVGYSLQRAKETASAAAAASIGFHGGQSSGSRGGAGIIDG